MLEERLVFNVYFGGSVSGSFITPAAASCSHAATVFAIVLSATVASSCHLF
jgi:hypothetical protein